MNFIPALFGVLALICSVNGFPKDSPQVAAQVDLGYSTYRGARLAAGVDQYLGMRYAAPPLGKLRFRAPQDPIKTRSVQNAIQEGPICIGVGQNAVPNQMAEDCLYINVYSPSNATQTSKLPVWVFIQGGGYAQNSNPNYNGTRVIEESGHAIVFVNFNYRVGALGFLASEKVREDGDLNVGLLDQRKALKWIKKHIQQFGGDPDHVVIHGASAGAGSVTYHLAAYGGKDEGLFVGGISESPFWPTQRTVEETEWQFDRFVEDCGCSSSKDALSCLRSLDIATIHSGNLESVFPNTEGNPTPRWYFLPVVDGDLIVDRLYSLFDKGRFVKVPVIVGNDNDEGSYFAYNASTRSDIARFFKNNYPRLEDSHLDSISQDYSMATILPNHAAYFAPASDAYGDAIFTCPGNYIASSVAKHVSPAQAWNYRVNVQDLPSLTNGIGVPHTVEIPAIFGPQHVGSGGVASFTTYNAGIVPVTMHYWISFIRSLDPNTYRYPGSPGWESWGLGDGVRLRLQTNATGMEPIPDLVMKRCELWESLSSVMEV